MNNKESSHILFDWDKIFISNSLVPLFNFLWWIEEEIKSLLWFNNKKSKIKDWYMESLDFILHTADILKQNNIKNTFQTKINHSEIANLFEIEQLLRVEFISLFSYLETLIYIYTAYNEETSNQNDLMKFVNGNREYVEKFYKTFLLNEENNYFKKNKNYLARISPKELRNLRNNLTHFFWVSQKITIIPENNKVKEKVRKSEKLLNKNKWNDIWFISSNDLYQLLISTAKQLIIIFNNDFINNPDSFNSKIKYVEQIVKEKAPLLVKNWDINIKDNIH